MKTIKMSLKNLNDQWSYKFAIPNSGAYNQFVKVQGRKKAEVRR